jgi:hypothetical protein
MMLFPEFLEFIGRLADFKFKNSPELAQNTLCWKIESILEDMLPAFNMVKNDVNKEQEENSQSDDDY